MSASVGMAHGSNDAPLAHGRMGDGGMMWAGGGGGGRGGSSIGVARGGQHLATHAW